MNGGDGSWQQCPNCKLLSPPTAQLCDCGWDFSTKTFGPRRPEELTLSDYLSGIKIAITSIGLLVILCVVGYVVIVGIAALPIGLAIIIGALIIASALRK